MMPILSFDAGNRHDSLDYFTYCTHMWRGMIMNYINSTMHHTILCKSIGGFRGGGFQGFWKPLTRLNILFNALSMWSQSLDGRVSCNNFTSKQLYACQY